MVGMPCSMPSWIGCGCVSLLLVWLKVLAHGFSKPFYLDFIGFPWFSLGTLQAVTLSARNAKRPRVGRFAFLMVTSG